MEFGAHGSAHVTRLETARLAKHVYHLLVVRVPERDAVLESLHRDGVGAGIHYPKLLQWQEAWTNTADRDATPHAAALATSILSLPVFPGITERQIERTVEALRSATGQQHNFVSTLERN